MGILVTGAAGFVGFHTIRKLLDCGEQVIGVDSVNDYYDPTLKHARLAELTANDHFSFIEGDLADGVLDRVPNGIDRIIHLAAQAGVRYSIENPMAYVRSNLAGHTAVLEFARHKDIKRTVYASSSSVYGGNTETPFAETHRTDDPVSFYGATKKSNELLSNSYARLYGTPLVGLRFFTVYGPWGRPDMAYWIFTQKILNGEPIRIFNEGKMGRDFTYIDDCVSGILGALTADIPFAPDTPPHRVYNLGNDQPEALMTLVETLEAALGTSATYQFEPMQQGDVERTWANIDRARTELGYNPTISLQDGLQNFVNWYRSHFNV